MTETERVAQLMQDPRSVFVFGSNMAGRHGKGAALIAKQLYGATQGYGWGHWGRSWAIPTKDQNLRPLPLRNTKMDSGFPCIETYVRRALRAMPAQPEKRFVWTRVGCGLAGYTDAEMVSILPDHIPSNVILPPEWVALRERS